ncbi:hypothetical protein SERLA73DRAFT_191621 [Serpula lacrymans var. lacrymans S7.3]|uniref:Uncharacterized protein n=2 Tax=Serpula lacrymans var. lacrymans TaxID=341189 RepID=F8QHY4_SERL3|nr:uncharacterized protein SERLADRAFT_477003 [Serpula lacrymans var. lacrymans S7.9]EGN92093.1 hypothetical protein SERLA73DRAFT_191621 [Serpula lacrymans var. lacrymans S7.3]EGO20615.1 hypothetical protein SERLADRAFT_477003 [Serpula lacrymans var. lacrymans S7.9]
MPKSTTFPLVEGEPNTYTLSVLAYDVHNGLCYYAITLSLFPVPALDVTLLAAQTTSLSPTSQPSQCSPDNSPIIPPTPLTTATSNSLPLTRLVPMADVECGWRGSGEVRLEL